MKKYKLILVSLVFFVSACAASPINQWGQAATTYNAALSAVTELGKAGKLSNSDIQNIEQVRVITRDELDNMRDAALRGEDSNFQKAKRVVTNGIAFIQRYLPGG